MIECGCGNAKTNARTATKNDYGFPLSDVMAAPVYRRSSPSVNVV
jgi:hypothetical protein